MKPTKPTSKRGGREKWFIAIAVMLISASIASALQVKTYDETMFETDAFQTNDTITITAESEGTPLISVGDSGSRPMAKIDEGNYQTKIQVGNEGDFNITVKDGNDTVTKQIFVVNDLGFNWTEVESELENDKQMRQQIIENATKQAQEQNNSQQEQKMSFFQRIISFFKNFFGIGERK